MRAALVLLLLVPAFAHADERGTTADGEAHAAEELAAAAKYTEAAVRFRAAYHLDPKPAHLCNVGVAYYRAKDLPRAELYLGRCTRMGQGLDKAFLDLASKALEDVEAKLRAADFAPTSVQVTPDTATWTIRTFDADETFVGSQSVWLPFGSHTVSATAEGYTAQQQSLDVRSREPVHVRVELTRTPTVPPIPQPPRAAPAPRSPVAAIETHRSKLPAIAATVVTAGVAGSAVAMFFHARSIMDTAAATTIDRDEYNRRIDRARNWQHLSWGAAGLAGAGAVVSTLLFIRASGSTSVEVTPSASGGAVTISGHW